MKNKKQPEIKVPKKRGPGRPRKETLESIEYTYAFMYKKFKEQKREINALKERLNVLLMNYDNLLEESTGKSERIADLEEKLRRDNNNLEKLAEKTIELEWTKDKLLAAEKQIQSIDSLKMAKEVVDGVNKIRENERKKQSWIERFIKF